MDHKYGFEELINENDETYTIEQKGIPAIIYILCYHITDIKANLSNIKYPFLQFMLDKISSEDLDFLMDEKFIFPYIIYSGKNSSKSIETLVIEKINYNLRAIKYKNYKPIDKEAYKGLFVNMNNVKYALVNISSIDINYLELKRNNLVWFALPSEIINNRNICNIPIDNEVVELFTTIPKISLLEKENNNYYILPDVAYTGSYMNKIRFNAVFGAEMSLISKGYYYLFYRDFIKSVKEGGWYKTGGNKPIKIEEINENKNNEGLCVENIWGRYVNGGICRYAVFIENAMIYYEDNDTLSLDENQIDNCIQDTIIVSYRDQTIIEPDLIVKNELTHMPLTCHMLDKETLGEKYDFTNKKFMIL